MTTQSETPIYCGSLTLKGHGDNAKCGRPYYGEIYQCESCKMRQLEREVTALTAQLAEALQDAEVGRKWRENSSLEEWFPFTAQELAAARRDAERYRWINKQHHFLLHIAMEPDQRKEYRLRCGECLDSWVDARIEDDKNAAMKEPK